MKTMMNDDRNRQEFDDGPPAQCEIALVCDGAIRASEHSTIPLADAAVAPTRPMLEPGSHYSARSRERWSLAGPGRTQARATPAAMPQSTGLRAGENPARQTKRPWHRTGATRTSGLVTPPNQAGGGWKIERLRRTAWRPTVRPGKGAGSAEHAGRWALGTIHWSVICVPPEADGAGEGTRLEQPGPEHGRRRFGSSAFSGL